jgi:hypothetical protein
MRLIRDGDLPARRPLSPLPGNWIASLMTPTPANRAMSGHRSCGVFALRRGRLAGQGFRGQVRIAKCAVGGAG